LITFYSAGRKIPPYSPLADTYQEEGCRGLTLSAKQKGLNWSPPLIRADNGDAVDKPGDTHHRTNSRRGAYVSTHSKYVIIG